MSHSSGIQAANISWDENGQPLSSRYDDVYFSRHNGLAESRYVFLQQNQLAERWQADFEHSTFYIAETGFGSGLNFLAAWQLWEQSANRPSRLHFISVENEPLQRDDLAKALALWPELASYIEQLLAVYPDLPLEGFHNFRFAHGQLRLTLIVNDASAGLKQLLRSDHPLYQAPFHRGVDAWFLDGFAPAKNPDMWQATLFDTIAALSGPGTSLATFTAAGLVRRELQRVGFTVEKRPGYGRKREMVAAHFEAPRIDPSALESGPLPWHVAIAKPPLRKETVIIGAGLAGCHTARALAERGWEVCVLEAAQSIASGASGNLQGMVYGKLSADTDGLALFNLAALRHAAHAYEPYWQDGSFGQQCGLLMLPRHEKEAQLQHRVADRFARDRDFLRLLSAADASTVAGVPIHSNALFYPQLGWIKPALLCQALLDHPNISVKTDSAASALHYQPSNGRWRVDGADGSLAESATVVVANSYSALSFAQIHHLPLKPVRGQLSYFHREQIPLRTIVCGEGYIAPATEEPEGIRQSFGATFTLREHRPEVLPADHEANLQSLAALIPDYPIPDNEPLSGRTAFRCSSADYLPLVGPVPDYEDFVARYRSLGHNARAAINAAGRYWPGLYLNVGHGSRGLAYGALSGELLAAQMSGDVLPVARDLATAVNPARFIIRDLIRRRIG